MTALFGVSPEFAANLHDLASKGFLWLLMLCVIIGSIMKARDGD